MVPKIKERHRRKHPWKKKKLKKKHKKNTRRQDDHNRAGMNTDLFGASQVTCASH